MLNLHSIIVGKKYQRLLVGGFFVGLLSLGLWLHRDYGISWDEPNNHLNGLVSVKYLAQLVAPALAKQHPLIPDMRAGFLPPAAFAHLSGFRAGSLGFVSHWHYSFSGLAAGFAGRWLAGAVPSFLR